MQPPNNYPIYTNRGASGIDGLLATAAGVAIAHQRPLIAFYRRHFRTARSQLFCLIQKGQIRQPLFLLLIMAVQFLICYQ